MIETKKQVVIFTKTEDNQSNISISKTCTQKGDNTQKDECKTTAETMKVEVREDNTVEVRKQLNSLLEEAIMDDKIRSEIHLLIAHTFYLEENYESTIKELEKALKYNKKNLRAIYKYVMVQVENRENYNFVKILDNFTNAIKQIEKYGVDDGKNPVIREYNANSRKISISQNLSNDEYDIVSGEVVLGMKLDKVENNTEYFTIIRDSGDGVKSRDILISQDIINEYLILRSLRALFMSYFVVGDKITDNMIVDTLIREMTINAINEMSVFGKSDSRAYNSMFNLAEFLIKKQSYNPNKKELTIAKWLLENILKFDSNRKDAKNLLEQIVILEKNILRN